MTLKKTVSLILAIVMIFSCAAIFSSCDGNNGGKSKVPMSKRTHVYSEEVLGNCEIPGYVRNMLSDGENIIMNYDVTYTVVYDTEPKEVERFEGYYYDYSSGVYEPIVIDDVILYKETAVLEDAGETVVNIETDDETPVTVEPAIIGPVDIDQPEIEGEPDEFGVITDENYNIKVPDGWHIEYVSENVITTYSLASGESTRSKVDFSDVSEITSGYNSGAFMGSDGKLKMLYNVYNYDEVTFISQNKYYILTLEANNGVYKVSDIKCLNDSFAKAGLSDEGTYIYSVVMLSDGNYYFSDDGGNIYFVDGEMNYKGKIELGGGYINTMSSLGDSLLVAKYDETYSNQKYYVVKDGAATPLEADGLFDSYVYGALGGYDGKIYLQKEVGVWCLDTETGEYGEELNFINSDIDFTKINNLVLLNDGRMLMTTTDWSVGEGKTTVSVLTKVPDDQIKEEVIVTIGAIWNNYDLIRSIMKYNKQSDGIRINLKTYDSYNNAENDWMGAATQLNNEIISGSLPDIIMLDPSLPTQSYFQKGVFYDLNKFIDDDEIGLDRSEYLDNVLRANETNGKLYSIITSFYVTTLAAKEKYVGKEMGWTFEEMVDAIKNMPAGMEAFYGTGRDSILGMIPGYAMSSLVDWTTGDTKFDTQAFRDYITYLAKCPEKGMWEEYYESMSGGEYVYDEDKEREISEKLGLKFWNDTCLFDMVSISTFDTIRYAYSAFASRDVTFIGFPTDDEKSNGAVIDPSNEYAISAKSQVKEQAWDFIKYLLSYDDEAMWQFTLNRKNLDKMEETALKNAENEGTLIGGYVNDYEWLKEMGYSDDYINFQMNSNIKLDKEMINLAREIVENANIISRGDSELNEIINDELSGFFAGTKTVEDTTRVIASRAKIMISTKS